MWDFSDPQNKGSKKIGEYFGAFFVRKFVAQKKIFRAKFTLQTCHLKEMPLSKRPPFPIPIPPPKKNLGKERHFEGIAREHFVILQQTSLLGGGLNYIFKSLDLKQWYFPARCAV